MVIAIVALIATVAANGWSGLRLAAGARSDVALHTRDWWIGTGLQGVGFFTALVARTVLPLVLVQSSIAGALAVTAALEHLTGVRRMHRAQAWAVVATVGGIAAVACAVVPGTTRQASWGDVAAVAGLLAVAGLATPRTRHPGALGAWAGLSFGAGAVAARLLVGGQGGLEHVWRFWAWSPLTWAVAVGMPAGIVLGQWALTRGLARGPSMAALGSNYLVATVVPSLLGMLLLGEQLRSGTAPIAVAGVALALWGTRRLLRVT